jgi:hypothetical protein
MDQNIKEEPKVIYKGDWIKNPKNNRNIKAGGRTYNKLLAEGVELPKYRDPNDLGEYTPERVKALRIAKKDEDFEIVKGRGKYKGRITIKKKRNSAKTQRDPVHFSDAELRVIMEGIPVEQRKKIIAEYKKDLEEDIRREKEEQEEEDDEDYEPDDSDEEYDYEDILEEDY